MKIRTRFFINIVVLGSILLLVSVAMVVTNQSVEKTHQQQELAAQIEREAYELGYLANDYLLYGESQQASRWESKFASFSDHLSNLQVDTPEQQALLAGIKSNQQRLKAVFEEVKTSIEAAPQMQETGFDEKFVQVFWSQLEVQNQGMIFNASRLGGMLNEQEHDLEGLTRLLSLVLIGVFGVFLSLNYGLSFRRILQAIANLQSGTRVIGSGNLDFAIEVSRNDEIGELSHAFNRMTGQLRTITASRGELEREIAERKQAEKALRESEKRYRGLIESQLDLIVRVNPEGRFTFANDAYCQKFGLKREEILGRESYKPLVHPEDLPHTLEAMKALYQPPYRAIMEQRAFAVEGVRWIEWQDSAIRDETGTIVEIQAIGRDITARKQAEEALHASEQRLKRAQEIAHLGSWELDLINNQLTWSDEVYRIFGLQPQEFAATYEAFLEAVHPEDRAVVDDAYAGSIRAGKDSYEIEHRVIRRSTGEIRIVHEKCEHFRDQSGQIIRSVGMVHDLTERKQAEAEIASLAKFPTENPNPILRVQTDARLTYANAASQELLDEWDCKVNDYLPQELRDLIAVALDDNLPKTVDVFCKDKVYSILLVPIVESGYVNIYGRDITERKQAEEKVQRSEAMLRSILDQLPSGVTVRDVHDGTLILSNARSREIMGRLVESATQFTKYHGFHSDGRAYQTEDWPLSRSMASGEVVHAEEVAYERSDGTRITLSINSAPVRDPQGQIMMAVGVFDDITERKRAEEELRRTLEELKYSNAELEQFAYVASHDLQEPLRMVSSYMQLLAKRYQGKLDRDADEFIAFAVDGAKRMQTLINDLLTFSRVGRRGKPLVFTSCEEAIEEAISNLQIAIEESGASLTYETLPQVQGDPTQLVQLFQNLLSNAIKFRGPEPPCIYVGVRQEDTEWIFSVRDNGIGIDPKFADRIFVIFQRLHHRESYPGTGIGLAICKRIVQRHGGRIWVESQPGRGATFCFTLPSKETT
jgi:PAS domain S-box-containing protein